MPLPDGRPSLYDRNPRLYSHSRELADRANKANDARRASPEYRAREASIRAALTGHHADVAPHGNGGHGGNPNHDEHGRFT